MLHAIGARQELGALLSEWAYESRSFLDGKGEPVFLKPLEIAAQLKRWLVDAELTCSEPITEAKVHGCLTSLHNDQKRGRGRDEARSWRLRAAAAQARGAVAHAPAAADASARRRGRLPERG